MPEAKKDGRVVSIRLEVQLYEVGDLRAVRDELVARARQAVEPSIYVRAVYEAGSVLRKE